MAHGRVATLEKGLAHQTMAIACEVAPCREPNDKLLLAAFERFTTPAFIPGPVLLLVNESESQIDSACHWFGGFRQ